MYLGREQCSATARLGNMRQGSSAAARLGNMRQGWQGSKEGAITSITLGE